MTDHAIRVASTTADDPHRAIAELFAQLDPPSLAGVILFCSSRYPREALEAALAARDDRIEIVGCTSSGEITPSGIDEGTIVAIGFPKADFRLTACRFEDLDHFDAAVAQRAVRSLVAEAQAATADFAGDLTHAAIFLVDGLSHREELLTLTIQDALGDVPLIGGSSGDGLNFLETFVLHDGRFRRDAAVVAILSTTRPLHVFRTHHHRPGDTRMVITAADSATRIVHEINAEPAAAEYARLAGVPVDQLSIATFATRPPIVRAGGEYFVRSIRSANPDGSLTFYCAIDEGLVMTLGHADDVLGSVDAQIAAIEAAVGSIDRVIGFDCVLNSVEVEQRQLRGALSTRYAAARVIGFNTYGEQYRALHVNQTLTGLAIGRAR